MIDWNIIGIGSNVALTAALVGVTWWYARQVKKQVDFIENDRYSKEMEFLVSPLYARIENHVILMKKVSGGIYEMQQEYVDFWDDIKKYMYLGSDDLRKNLREYFKCETNPIRSKETEENHKTAERNLIESITNRYEELEKIIK